MALFDLVSNPGVLNVFIWPHPPVEPDQVISYPYIAVKSSSLSYLSAVNWAFVQALLAEPSAKEAAVSLSNQFEWSVTA